MPRDKDVKRLVRERMRKTGESYTAARAQLLKRAPLQKQGDRSAPEPDLAELAGMADERVREKTGRTWKQWTLVLDRVGARELSHRDIARHLSEVEGVADWWCQMVAVGYERIRGLREKGQRRGGGFDVNKSKTVPVPVERLFAAFEAPRRARWLGGAKPRVKKATPHKTMRLTWDDGRPVELYFTPKGASKSQVALQHRELPTKADAERVRSEWTERLTALAEYLKA
jgi:hypothetical protein